MPIYRVNPNAPCEMQMYIQRQQYHQNCNKKHIISSEFWITINQPHTWLYSVVAEQHIVIECDGRHKHGEIIKNTGKIILKGKCKLTTPDMTVQSREVILQTETETYLPEANMTLLRDQKPLTNNTTLDSTTPSKIRGTKNKTRKNKQQYRKQWRVFYDKTVYIPSDIKWHNYDNCNNYYNVYNYTAQK